MDSDLGSNLRVLARERGGLTLLVAPPAWGKSSLLQEIVLDSNSLWIFLSPLRVLADQLYERFLGQFPLFLISNGAEREKKISRFCAQKEALMLITPELCSDLLFEHLERSGKEVVWVLDEFHLFFYWGESFRWKMWELFLQVANRGDGMLALSATISKEYLERMQLEFRNTFTAIFMIDLGNQQFGNYPSKIYYFSMFLKNLFFRRFEYDLYRRLRGQEPFLLFCKYRSQVDHMVEKYRAQGFRVLGCKGGEGREFILSLRDATDLDCIFATSVLGHGVNLPRISRVYLGYRVGNLDFWLQMATRGGREGDSYQVYTFDSYFQSAKGRIFSIISVLLTELMAKSYFFFHDRANEN